MKNIYCFFEIIYYQINRAKLQGQSEENKAHFAALILTLLIDFNLLTVLIVLDKLKIVPLIINNEYIAIAFVLLTYLAVYLLFVRKSKYNIIKEKYLEHSGINKNKTKYYLGFYVIGTFLLFLFVVII